MNPASTTRPEATACNSSDAHFNLAVVVSVFLFERTKNRMRSAHSRISPPKKNLILSGVRLRRASFLRGFCAAGGGGGAGSSYFKYSAKNMAERNL